MALLLLPLCQQFMFPFALTIRRGIEGPLFNYIVGILRDAQRMVDRLVDLIDADRFLDGLAGTLIGGLSIGVSLLDAAAEHQDRTSVCKVAVHAVVLDLVNDIGLLH